MSDIEWVGVRPEDRRMRADFCCQCGIQRGVEVLNYRGPCRHSWETVTFAPVSTRPPFNADGTQTFNLGKDQET